MGELVVLPTPVETLSDASSSISPLFLSAVTALITPF
jgi:hypothetical protein